MSSILRPLQLDESPPEPTTLARSRRVAPPLGKLSRPSVGVTLPKIIPVKEYLQHLPILVIGLGLYAVILFVLNTVDPDLVQNVWIPNSYAPLLILVGAANFCFFSYVFLNTRRGFLSGLYLTVLLFLKLQQVLTPSLAIWTAGVFVVTELIFIVLHRIFLRFQPTFRIPSMPSFPSWRGSRQDAPSDAVETSPLKPVTPSKKSSRHGRKRKHHFFGK